MVARTWTNEQLEIAERMWNEGYFTREIANLLNNQFNTKRTKNAIIAQAYIHEWGERDNAAFSQQYQRQLAKTKQRRWHNGRRIAR